MRWFNHTRLQHLLYFRRFGLPRARSCSVRMGPEGTDAFFQLDAMGGCLHFSEATVSHRTMPFEDLEHLFSLSREEVIQIHLLFPE
jgi:hypothetical protein